MHYVEITAHAVEALSVAWLVWVAWDDLPRLY